MTKQKKDALFVLDFIETQILTFEKKYCVIDHQMPTKIEMKFQQLKALIIERIKD